MKFNIVDILNTGVTGFAFIMLYLGYRLTASVQSKILDKNPEEFHDLAFYREWAGIVRNQLNNTRYFLLFAAIFFAGGLTLLIYQPKNSIILAVYPEVGDLPIITLQNKKIKLDQDGTAYIQVRNDHNIRVNYDNILKEISNLKLELKNKNFALKNTVIDSVSTSSEAGFDLN